jgi:hypothetical protein
MSNGNLVKRTIPAFVFLSLAMPCLASGPDKIARAREEAEQYAKKSEAYRQRPARKLTQAELKAEELFAKAEEMMALAETPAEVEPALKLCREATRLASGYDKSWWELAKALCIQAMLMPQNTTEQKQAAAALLSQAREACDTALHLDPMSLGGNYWLSNILLADAGLKNPVRQVFLLPEIFRLTDKVAELDPYFEYGGVFRTYATVLSVVPLWLSKSVGYEPEIILPYLDKAIALYPDCFVNYISRSEVYLKIGDPQSRNLALKDLEYVLTHDPDSLKGYEADNRSRKKAARAAWKQITGKDFPQR